ncbi:hypothetical protein PAXRUDRAFT_460254 [Paxillus rubicundulus Ve08.2h10]|uniref:Unplaced genomic scaffold scaffold_298, whole genome shotgun sequence n=1 Tax=Paxillus rubicundulus Ve08.2h10 TaxID=930991 RepID=A0A0D0E7Q9_9AGAM|nr:hypothetical protein PAXRUDRAFT_460254 [Paxillus rubicundulus Ve08.2h10]
MHTATSPFYAAIFSAGSTPTPTQLSTENETIQPRTVFGIVLGLTGFVLILSFPFLYRRCFPSESTSRGSSQDHRDVCRRRPRAPHVNSPVSGAPRGREIEPAHGAPPPYDALRLPLYAQQSLPHTQQNSPLPEQSSELHSPPMARLDV